jgi:hypothetical protein
MSAQSEVEGRLAIALSAVEAQAFTVYIKKKSPTIGYDPILSLLTFKTI